MNYPQPPRGYTCCSNGVTGRRVRYGQTWRQIQLTLATEMIRPCLYLETSKSVLFSVSYSSAGKILCRPEATVDICAVRLIHNNFLFINAKFLSLIRHDKCLPTYAVYSPASFRTSHS